ncbi:hypothetical protein P8C59_004813 [Phyllachora maydis]|uniref:Alpha-ketoglutarate-dependent dioxygenase AlkB-like domain-containing protein n=1 Tax=Phyllachora maydis TaxID=1825666 RepID=A0AAD9I344_9PEZI|nr:hypothetical protein P8C59_004813 [Phyllachora maydis]
MDQARFSSILDEARIYSLPPSAFYIPDFITRTEEQMLLEKIAAAPKPRWRQLSHRRLQTWPSDLVNDAVVDAPLPSWLEEPVVPRLLSIAPSDSEPNLFASSPHGRPNHVLVNEYEAGSGISPHKDGDAYYAAVATNTTGTAKPARHYE